MRVLVVDDEAPARARLIRLLESLGPPYEVVGEAANGIEALACCRRLEVELLLLDVRMPGMDGLELAAELGRWQPPPAIIFTTAYSEHALDSFDSQAVDYLLKPVRAERLERARSPTRAQLQVLTGADEPHLSYSLGGSLHRLALSEVLYFRAEQKYVVVRHRGGEGLLEETLKSQECRYLVKDFGTSQSPKSTRQRDSRYCPDRPALITTPSRTLQQSCSCATPS
ncbi:MAG: response regulator transcription factor [Candidatus Sedimenticola endophacoides]